MHRALLMVALAATHASAQHVVPPDTITTVADGDTIPHFGAVGGVAVDGLGYVYHANFRNAVWRFTPGVGAERHADGLYGASGNAIGPRGELYQSSFTGNYVSRVDRDGTVTTLADSGLNGPVGIAVGDDGTLVICNCTSNEIVRIDRQGTVTVLASGPLFACPNGITRDDRGDFYVVNFSNTTVVRITPDGSASAFADIPGSAGNGHIIFARDGFYVTKFRGHQVFRLHRDGTSRVIAGTGTRGHTDGPALEARLSQPNGIAWAAATGELWINELVSGNGVRGGAARSLLRRIRIITVADVIAAAEPGPEAVRAAYAAYKAARPGELVASEAIAAAYAIFTPQRNADALAIFELAADDHPDDPDAQYHLGEAYRYTQQPDKAAAQYRKALELQPDHPSAASRLAAVRGR